MRPICRERRYLLSTRNVPGAGLRTLSSGDHLIEWPDLGQATAFSEPGSGQRTQCSFCLTGPRSCWGPGAAPGGSSSHSAPCLSQPAQDLPDLGEPRKACCSGTGTATAPRARANPFPFPSPSLILIPRGSCQDQANPSIESTLQLAELAEWEMWLSLSRLGYVLAPPLGLWEEARRTGRQRPAVLPLPEPGQTWVPLQGLGARSCEHSVLRPA